MQSCKKHCSVFKIKCSKWSYNVFKRNVIKLILGSLKYGHSHALFSKALKECKCGMWVKLMLMVKAITSAVYGFL